MLRLTSASSATPAAGIGVGMEFEVETTAGNEVIAGIEAVTTDVGSGTEAGDLVFKTMTGGAAADEKMRIENTGDVGIGTSNPTSLLDIYRATGGSAELRIRVGNGNGALVRTANTGRSWDFGV